MYQRLGDLFGTQKIGSFEGESSVAAHSGYGDGGSYFPVAKGKWAADRKLRLAGKSLEALRALQAKLTSKKFSVTDPNQLARITNKLNHVEAAIKTATVRKNKLISEVAIKDSGALSGFGDATSDCVAKGTPAIQATFAQEQAIAAGDPAKIAAATTKMQSAMQQLATSCQKSGTLKKVLLGAGVLALGIAAFMFFKHKKAVAVTARRRKNRRKNKK